MRKYLRWYLPVLTGVVILLVWVGLKAALQIGNFVLPSPLKIVQAAIAERHLLWQSSLVTLTGASLGFVTAALAGILGSMVMALSANLRLSVYPYILVLQMTPIAIFAPVLVIWLGPGLPVITVITFLICFFPIVANTTQGLISVDRNMVDLFRMINADRVQEVVLLRVPHALPYFLTGLRIAGSIAMIGGITGDFFAGNSDGGVGGLGFLVLVYNAQLKVPALWATGFCACLCGFIFVTVVIGLNWFLLRKWHDSIVKSDL
jgi:NitT/TauT family transport system permease protein